MAMTADDYYRLLLSLLPPGKVYSRGGQGSMHDTLKALAQEFARIDSRIESLLDEADPRTTTEMLPDWEKALKLPEDGADLPDTVIERRRAIIGKLTGVGGQSRAFYIQLAASLGYAITITEFRPYTCMTPIDQGIHDESARFTWMVNAPETTITEATCQSTCVDPLRAWGNELLERSINKRKRASRTVVFSYGG